MITVIKYLAGIFASRAMYSTLFNDAINGMPPADPDKRSSEQLVSEMPLREVALRLGVSETTMRADLRRLERFKWVERRGNGRYLGTREGVKLFLLADLAAEEATGAPNLVQKLQAARIAAAMPAPLPQAPPQASAPVVARFVSGTGAARRWA